MSFFSSKRLTTNRRRAGDMVKGLFLCGFVKIAYLRTLRTNRGFEDFVGLSKSLEIVVVIGFSKIFIMVGLT